jgi:hypothetical protein
LKRLLGFALIAGAAVLLLPTCRSTRHTVARIATPVPVPTEVFIPAEPAAMSTPVVRAAATPTPVVPAAAPVVPPGAPAAPRVTAVAPTAPPMPSPTPTSTPMPVVTARPEAEPSPGVLYEQPVPTVVAVTPEVTPEVTPIATRAVTARSTRPPRTPTPAPTQRPGAYYEDEEGRPLTPTPAN